MALRLSTGTQNKLLDTAPLKTIFAAGFLDIYTGTQPATANDAATGTKLCTIYSDGTAAGISWAVSAALGVLLKLASETWSTTILADGTAGWFRLREATDAGTAATTTLARIDGAIATSGAQMNLGSLAFTAGAPFIMASASITLPANA